MGSIKLTPEQIAARAEYDRRRRSRPLAEVEKEIRAERRERARVLARSPR